MKKFPLVATSLALALSTSYAENLELQSLQTQTQSTSQKTAKDSNPQVLYGKANGVNGLQISEPATGIEHILNLSDLTWTQAGTGGVKPTTSSSTTIENFTMKFTSNGTEGQSTENPSTSTSDKTYTIDYKIKSTTWATNDQIQISRPTTEGGFENLSGESLRFAANSKGIILQKQDGSLGTFTLDMGNFRTEKVRSGTLVFDGGITNTSSLGFSNLSSTSYSLIANLALNSGDGAVVDVSFKNSMKGDIIIGANGEQNKNAGDTSGLGNGTNGYALGTKGTITFGDNANLEGSYRAEGLLVVGGTLDGKDAYTNKSFYTITFGDGSNGGKNTITEGISTGHGYHAFTFKDEGEILGGVRAENRNYGRKQEGILSAQNTIIFEKKGLIDASLTEDKIAVFSNGLGNNITFKDEGIIKGKIFLHRDGNSVNEQNTITFEKKGLIDASLTEDKIAVFSDGDQANTITFKEDGEIKGGICAKRGSWIASNGSAFGKNTITFGKKGIITGDISTLHNKVGNGGSDIKNTITFGESGSSIQGSLIANTGTNTITFEKDGSITGKEIVSGTNTITFGNTSASSTSTINIQSSIRGGGTTTILFKNGSGVANIGSISNGGNVYLLLGKNSAGFNALGEKTGNERLSVEISGDLVTSKGNVYIGKNKNDSASSSTSGASNPSYDIDTSTAQEGLNHLKIGKGIKSYNKNGTTTVKINAKAESGKTIYIGSSDIKTDAKNGFYEDVSNVAIAAAGNTANLIVLDASDSNFMHNTIIDGGIYTTTSSNSHDQTARNTTNKGNQIILKGKSGGNTIGIRGDITSWAHTAGKAYNKITLTDASIVGSISARASSKNNAGEAKNDISLETQGSISGNVIATATKQNSQTATATNTITFKQSGSIGGDVIASGNGTSSNSITFGSGTTLIASSQSKDTSPITGTIAGNVSNTGTTTLDFSNAQSGSIGGSITNTSGTTEIKLGNTSKATTLTLKGDVLRNSGTTKITFNDESSLVSLAKQGGLYQIASIANGNSKNQANFSFDADYATLELNNGGSGFYVASGKTLNLTFKALEGTLKSNLHLQGSTLNLNLSSLSSATLDGKVILGSNGKTNVSFMGSHATLILQEGSAIVENDSNKVNHYKLDTIKAVSSTSLIGLEAQQAKENPQAFNTISFLGKRSHNTSSFILLEMGSKAQQQSLQNGSNGAQAGNLAFNLVVNPNATSQTLAGVDASNGASKVKETNTYGYAYSDRVLVHSGDNTSKTYTLNLFPQGDGFETITYSSGGTETKGNVAVMTIKTSLLTSSQQATTSNQETSAKTTGNITVKTSPVSYQGEIVQMQLVSKATDENGKVATGINAINAEASAAGAGTSDYTTFFITQAQSLGVDPVYTQQAGIALSLGFNLYSANFNSLNKRMGELRDNPYNHGIWARIYGGEQINENVGSSTQYITLQTGYDYAFEVSKNAKNYLGIAVAYGDSLIQANPLYSSLPTLQNNILSFGNIQSQMIEVALYNSYIQESGWYNDTIVKFDYIMNDFIWGSNKQEAINNFGFIASNEVGYRLYFGEQKNFYLDPQFEMGVGYLSGSEINNINGNSRVRAQQGALFTQRYRAGSGFGFKTQGKDSEISLYTGVFYEYDVFQGGETTSNTSSSASKSNTYTPYSNTGRVIVNLGGNFQIQDNTRVYLDLEKSFLGKTRTYLQASAGVRYSFGEKKLTTETKQTSNLTPLKLRGE